jgi:hypothetical protein
METARMTTQEQDVREELLLRAIKNLSAERQELDRTIRVKENELRSLRETRKTPDQKAAELAVYTKALDDSIASETHTGRTRA